MCLGVPGEIVSIDDQGPLMRIGKVSFGGILKEVNLSYVPEARVGEYVIVHAGFAISRIDAEEARQVFEYLKEMDQLEELQSPEVGESKLSRSRVKKRGR